MPTAPTLHSLLEQALADVPALSRQLLNAIQDELSAKPQYFLLQEAWRRVRHRFAADFERGLVPLLKQQQQHQQKQQQQPSSNADPADSLMLVAKAAEPTHPGALTLVDEQQARQQVAIARVSAAIEDHNRIELHQLDNLFAALRGTAKPRKHDNPLRPAIFAQALHRSLMGSELDESTRYALMNATAQPMAQSLDRFYQALCQPLQAADLGRMVLNHGARKQEPKVAAHFAQVTHVVPVPQPNEPATLAGLSRRVQLQLQQQQPHRNEAAPASAAQPTFIAKPGPDMLSRLYEQILTDPRLLPPLKALLARLQVAVVRLARLDGSLLHRQNHATWLLLNRVAAHGMAFERADDARLLDFLKFMEAQAEQLIEASRPSELLFEQALQAIDQHLSRQARQRSEDSSAALALLEREQLRSQWLPLLREQIKEQIVGAPLGPQLHRFLPDVWVLVIVQAMVKHGHEAPAAHAAIQWVDQLLHSLQDAPGERGRQALMQRLPGLIQALHTGCDTIALPAAEREPILQELMLQHGRLLRGLSGLSEPAGPLAATPLPGLTQAMFAPTLTEEQLLQRLLDERESQLPEHWAHKSVDRGELPTMPLQLYEQAEAGAAQAAVAAWMEGLLLGSWHHLFIQGEWLTAQIAWVSDSGKYFLFVGQDAEERHSLTRGAIEQLLTHGLITNLDEISVLQLAMDTLTQALDDER
jgi:hypothetical protein